MNHTILKLGIVGAISAAAVDIAMFKNLKSLDDLAKFDFRVASVRWATGFVLGILTGLANTVEV